MYRTSKAWEVGRLIKGLGALGREMSGLEPRLEGEGEVMEAVEAEDAGKANTESAERATTDKLKGQEMGKAAGAGGKAKKKKGKR